MPLREPCLALRAYQWAKSGGRYNQPLGLASAWLCGAAQTQKALDAGPLKIKVPRKFNEVLASCCSGSWSRRVIHRRPERKKNGTA